MRKVTIQDIADELGISRNTVSKAINNSDGLAEATRERILQKATEMGYKQFSYEKIFCSDAVRCHAALCGNHDGCGLHDRHRYGFPPLRIYR